MHYGWEKWPCICQLIFIAEKKPNNAVRVPTLSNELAHGSGYLYHKKCVQFWVCCLIFLVINSRIRIWNISIIWHHQERTWLVYVNSGQSFTGNLWQISLVRKGICYLWIFLAECLLIISDAPCLTILSELIEFLRYYLRGLFLLYIMNASKVSLISLSVVLIASKYLSIS